ncbi:hypothetical protein OSB04_012044 [Centaurea solstitialis]|uniref:Retrovirus-related Pol polyprotein from transposon TNT 1-94 n=1 Tax=Centaurea solstitialis TaxID=347529 RepID=A0AA38TAN5_9ASTR|nr:hypothetical protein OSB04_012044 [Centaurea solstitialis]
MASTVTSTNNLSLRSILEKDKLTGSNFLDWERNLMIVLRHERKWYVLEEPLGEAPPANAPAAARNAHKKHSDDLLDVACLMLATMSPDLQAGLINTNAYDMIRQLRDMFQTQARTERYDATKAFNECKMVKGTSVSDHVMKMKRHLDHLERLGHPVPLQLATDTILNSLSEDYRPFVVNYNMNNMEKTIAELHSMLKTAELNMGNKNKTKDVLMVKDGGVKKKNGHASTSKGKGPVQAIQSAPKKGKGKGKGKKVKPNKARTENRCFICNEIGHWRQNCPKRHEAGMKLVSSLHSKSVRDNLSMWEHDKDKGIWYLDSGCSRHMTGSKSVLSDYRDERGPSVTFGGNGKGQTRGYGTLTNGVTTFKRVAYVEGLMHNLLSISQLCDKNHKVSFSKKKCKVKNRRKEVILTGVRQDDIYIINMNTSTDNFCFVSRASTDTNWLWHKRLSHLNFKTLNQLCINNLVVGLPDFRYTKVSLCSACEKGKQTRASFKSKQMSSISSPLQLLHMDLFGPINVQSIAGKKYTLVIVDEYSRYTWVFFLRSKSDAPEEIILFVGKMEKLNNLSVRSIRSDHGISQNFSSVRTPQQNGVAERRNRTLIEAARSMLSEANLATQFWAEAVNTACYTQNRSLIVKRFRRTPYELFRNRKPSIEHLHIFGCVCYILNNKDNLGKFDSKSDDGIFLGYSSISKTYHVFNKRRQTIEETIHVRFDESGPTFPHPQDNAEINQWADSFFQVPNIPIADPTPQDLPDAFEETPLPPSQISIPPIINATPITQVTPEPDQPTSSEDFFQTTVSEPAPTTTNLLPNPSINEASTSGQVYQPPALRWTKDHPIDQVLRNPSSGVKTRRQSGNVCLYVNFISENEPKEIGDALRDPAWVSAMQEELAEFIRNNVWLLVHRPRKRTIIGSKWIFRNKLDEVGTIIRNKARLVAQGYRQEEGIDY